MLDPHFTLSITGYQRDKITHEIALEGVGDPINTDRAVRIAEAVFDTYEPLTDYRAARLMALHIAVCMEPWSIPKVQTLDLVGSVLDGLAIPSLDTRRAKSAAYDLNRTQSEELLLKAFLAALVELGEPGINRIPDPLNPEKGMMTPAGAELLQHLSEEWSDTHPDIEPVYGADLIADASHRAGTQVLLPILLPADVSAWLWPNRPNARTPDHYRNWAGVPLAWTWDLDATARDKARPGQPAAITHLNYAEGYRGSPMLDLIASASVGTFTLPPDKRATEPGVLPRWVYSLVSIPAPYSPVIYGTATERRTDRRRIAEHLIGPFAESARLFSAWQDARFAAGIHTPFERDTGFVTTLDLPMIAMAQGAREEEALKLWFTSSAGVRQSWACGQGIDLKSPMVCPPYGQVATLVTGMRWVTLAALSGHLSGERYARPKARDVERGFGRYDPYLPLPQPVHGLLAEHERHHRLGAVEHRGAKGMQYVRRGPAMPATHPYARIMSDTITQSDVTAARTLISIGALSALSGLLSDPTRNPRFREWVQLAWMRVPGMLAEQKELALQALTGTTLRGLTADEIVRTRKTTRRFGSPGNDRRAREIQKAHNDRVLAEMAEAGITDPDVIESRLMSLNEAQNLAAAPLVTERVQPRTRATGLALQELEVTLREGMAEALYGQLSGPTALLMRVCDRLQMGKTHAIDGLRGGLVDSRPMKKSRGRPRKR